MVEYFEEGNACPHCAEGILETFMEGCCACHIHPPCAYCVHKNENLSCSKCGEDPYSKLENKDWEVVQYWDNIFDKVITTNLSETEARGMADSFKRNIYTTYGVRKKLEQRRTFKEWIEQIS